MKEILSSIISSLCYLCGVSRKELAISAACVLLGGAYLVYTYFIISMLA